VTGSADPATADTTEAMSTTGPVIRTLDELGDMDELLRVADRIWGTEPGAFVSSSFLMALVHAGGYVAGAFVDDEMVGVSFGMLASHTHGGRQEWCLHSHITGIEPDRQHLGLGRVLKRHQRDWSRARDLSAVTWTFDPLVRRNAWFNLHVLGAVAVSYHVDFYGALGDHINGVDDSDRLLAYWSVDAPRSLAADTGVLAPIVPAAGDALVSTPADIVEIRRTDAGEAHRWRRDMRTRLGPLLDDGHVVGITTDAEYVVSSRPIEETLAHGS
jgi:predicted GNAT superfamily acetyltransferase